MATTGDENFPGRRLPIGPWQLSCVFLGAGDHWYAVGIELHLQPTHIGNMMLHPVRSGLAKTHHRKSKE